MLKKSENTHESRPKSKSKIPQAPFCPPPAVFCIRTAGPLHCLHPCLPSPPPFPILPSAFCPFTSCPYSPRDTLHASRFTKYASRDPQYETSPHQPDIPDSRPARASRHRPAANRADNNRQARLRTTGRCRHCHCLRRIRRLLPRSRRCPDRSCPFSRASRRCCTYGPAAYPRSCRVSLPPR